MDHRGGDSHPLLLITNSIKEILILCNSFLLYASKIYYHVFVAQQKINFYEYEKDLLVKSFSAWDHLNVIQRDKLKSFTVFISVFRVYDN